MCIRDSRVANAVLGLDGEGGSELYADLEQWETDLNEKRAARAAAAKAVSKAERAAEAAPKKRLSYLEQREWDAMEAKIEEAEARLQAAQTALHAPETVSDPARIQTCYAEMNEAQAVVDQLYARWAELEAKIS